MAPVAAKKPIVLLATFVLAMCSVTGCGGRGGDDKAGGAQPAAATSPRPLPNGAPVITGTPARSVMHDTAYVFAPDASDPDGDPLMFSIANKPAWAAFDRETGALTGTPGVSDIGPHSAIEIRVSDGDATATLGPFGIEVIPLATGAVVLTWSRPTENADGTALADLAGYRIRWGSESGYHPNLEEVMNPDVTSHTIGNLAPGDYFLVISAVDTSNNESVPSKEVVASVD